MLKIRPEQMDAFQPVADKSFIRRVAEYLRDNHADVLVRLPNRSVSVGQISDEGLFELIRRGVERARSYELNLESDLNAYVVMMFVAAPNFDEHPLIQRLLKDKEIRPESRMDALWERISEQTWQVVEQSYNSEAWRVDDMEVSQ